MRVVASRQGKPPGDLESTEVKSGVRVKPDPEPKGYVKGLRNGFWVELAMFLVLIESVQDFVVDKAWGI